MARQAIETELLTLERRFWQSMMDKDRKAADDLTDFPCIVAGPQGVASLDKKAFAATLEAGNWEIRDFAFGDDVQVRRLSDDVALIAYKVREKLTVDREPVTLEAAETSVWVRRDGRWRCAMHTEALSGDPFGRDRKAAAH
ncbi:MAG: nuclear transport factor 2 family protein [Pseudomonadota bacterium]